MTELAVKRKSEILPLLMLVLGITYLMPTLFDWKPLGLWGKKEIFLFIVQTLSISAVFVANAMIQKSRAAKIAALFGVLYGLVSMIILLYEDEFSCSYSLYIAISCLPTLFLFPSLGFLADSWRENKEIQHIAIVGIFVYLLSYSASLFWHTNVLVVAMGLIPLVLVIVALGFYADHYRTQPLLRISAIVLIPIIIIAQGLKIWLLGGEQFLLLGGFWVFLLLLLFGAIVYYLININKHHKHSAIFDTMLLLAVIVICYSLGFNYCHIRIREIIFLLIISLAIANMPKLRNNIIANIARITPFIAIIVSMFFSIYANAYMRNHMYNRQVTDEKRHSIFEYLDNMYENIHLVTNLLCIAAAVVVIVVYLKSNKSENKTEEITETESADKE